MSAEPQEVDNFYPVRSTAAETGNNYGQLGFIVLILLIITILLSAAIWVGFWTAPVENTLEDVENPRPLVEGFPLNAMPNLPDSLAEVYDEMGEMQRGQLNSYRYTNAPEGRVSIPLDEAIPLMMENDGFPVRAETGE